MSGLLSKRLAELYRTLAHPVRLKILEMLTTDEQSVCQLCHCLKKRQSNVSQHLQVLRNQGLVSSQKVGKQRVYQVCEKYKKCMKQLLTLEV